MKKLIFILLIFIYYLIPSKILCKNLKNRENLHLDNSILVCEIFPSLDTFIGQFIRNSIDKNLCIVSLQGHLNFSNKSKFFFSPTIIDVKKLLKIQYMLKVVFETFTLLKRFSRDLKKEKYSFKDIMIDNFNFGKEIISRNINSRNFDKKYTSLDNFNMFIDLFIDILLYKIFSRIFEKSKPKLIIVNEQYLFPWSLIIKSALNNGINCLRYTGCHEINSIYLKKINKKNFYFHMTHFDLDDYVDFLKQKNIQDVKIKEYISNSYYKNKWFSRNQKMNIDQNTSYLNAQLLQKEFKNKKVIGVFPHIFWDSTAIYGEDLFENYYEWFVKILNYIELCSNPNRVWIIKLHPDLIFKVNKYNFKMLKLNKKLKTLQKKNLNVKILWPGYNILTTHLLDMIDVCLTVRGTVGIESALKGKATFTAGTGRYSNRGFTIDSNSIKNYLNLLTNLEDYVESSEKLITEAESYAKVIFLALPFKFSQPVFNTDKKGLCPFNDSINNLTDQDYANFKNWYDSEFELFKNLRF